MHYLDNAATTCVLPEVIHAANEMMESTWGNPSSLHTMGMKAEKAIEDARITLAKAMGCKKDEVVFTSGGTEANYLAILGAVKARMGVGRHIVSTGYEHSSVSNTLEMLKENENAELTIINPSEDGTVDVSALVDAVGPKTVLVTAMQVNNETGAVIDVVDLARRVKEKNSRCFVHVDGIQGFCKLPLVLRDTKIDSYAVSGHKIHALKGVGALYLRGGKSAHWHAPCGGGSQESGIRPGTQNTVGIVALGKAVELFLEQSEKTKAHISYLRSMLNEGLSNIPDITMHSPKDGYAGITMFSAPRGLRSQVMLNYLNENHDVYVSSGSACAGGKGSHTLSAMGVKPSVMDAALRVSFSAENKEEDVVAFLEGLKAAIVHLARCKG